jgi:hypothetical protein
MVGRTPSKEVTVALHPSVDEGNGGVPGIFKA